MTMNACVCLVPCVYSRKLSVTYLLGREGEVKPNADSSLHSPDWPAQTLRDRATQNLASDGISANSVKA